MRDPAGVAFRTRAPVLEYTTEAGHVVPQPTGLGATVSLSICPLVIWENNPRFCDPPLQIDKVAPDPHRENVALADPGFSVSFSEPIHLATLEAHFRLHTMDADSRPELVAGEWEVQGQARYVFRPSEDLRSGTLYRAVVPGGEGTILSQDNSAVLAEGQDWTFSTLLDFDQQRPEGPVAGSIRLHHYQVVRDGDLTRNKPTLTRAWFDWDTHPDIHPDWQPESFQMDFRMSEAAPRWQGQFRRASRGRMLRIWRSGDNEIFSDDDRRQALHSANYFGWRPRESGEFSIEIQQHNPWPRDTPLQPERQTHPYDVWQHDPRPLRLHYAFAKVAEWAEGVPPAAAQTARTLMREVARQVPSFFPHREVRIHRLAAPVFTAESAPDLVCL